MSCDQKKAKIIVDSNAAFSRIIKELSGFKSSSKFLLRNLKTILKSTNKRSEALQMQLEELEMDVSEFIFDAEEDFKRFKDLKQRVWQKILSKRLRTIAKGKK